MKRTILFVLLVFCTGLLSQNTFAQKSKTLITIADQEIGADDFMAVYKKNNQDNMVIDKKSVKEYLDLYINFKLKVIEAEALGLDTVPAFIQELAGYRTQLAKPYLIDEEVNRTLIEEAYQRKLIDVRASHILIKCDENAKASDTIAAYNKAMKVYELAAKGQDFGDLAVRYSDDPSAKNRVTYGQTIPGNRGDLSYFSVFHMVYAFEQAAFLTKVGEVSPPVRTSFGYHIVKVIDQVPALGKIQIAHILALVPKESREADSLKAYEKINEVLNKLNAGETWEDLAFDNSDDKGTNTKGGVLPWFTSNRLFPSFYEAIKTMEIGDYSNPIETPYGYHIIKILEHKEIGTFEENKDQLKRKIAKSDRADLSRVSLINKIKKDYHFHSHMENVTPFKNIVDASVFNAQWNVKKAEGLNAVVVHIGDKTYTQADFAEFLSKTQLKTDVISLELYVEKQFASFTEKVCIDYEDSQLENKHDEFRLLMQEYHDGILLYELADKKVWTKAIKDTTGLLNFYNDNKKNYEWNDRVKATKFTMTDVSIEAKVREIAAMEIPYDSLVKLVNEVAGKSVSIEQKFYEKGSNEIIDSFKWETGITETVEDGSKNIFLNIHEVLEPQIKELKEAKGLITADYQNYLDILWIKDLKEKYPVKINKRVLRKLKK